MPKTEKKQFSKVWFVPGGRFLLTQEENDEVTTFRLRDLGHGPGKSAGSCDPIASLDIDARSFYVYQLGIYPTEDSQGIRMFLWFLDGTGGRHPIDDDIHVYEIYPTSQPSPAFRLVAALDFRAQVGRSPSNLSACCSGTLLAIYGSGHVVLWDFLADEVVRWLVQDSWDIYHISIVDNHVILLTTRPSYYSWRIPPLKPRHSGICFNFLQDPPPGQRHSDFCMGLQDHGSTLGLISFTTWALPPSRPFRIGMVLGQLNANRNSRDPTNFAFELYHDPHGGILFKPVSTLKIPRIHSTAQYQSASVRFCDDLFLQPLWKSPPDAAREFQAVNLVVAGTTQASECDAAPKTGPHTVSVKVWGRPVGWGVTAVDCCPVSARFCVTDRRVVRILGF